MVTLFILELPDAANAGKVLRQQTIMASRHKKPVILFNFIRYPAFLRTLVPDHVAETPSDKTIIKYAGQGFNLRFVE